MFKGMLLVGALLILSGCHNYSANVGEVLGCTLAGNGCDSRGADGVNGVDGADGADGSSCSVSTVSAGPVAPNGGAQVLCENGTSALILNGANGADGASAPATPYMIAKIVTPCPSVPGSNKEVLLVLQNRSILASVSEQSNGKNTRLALLGYGTYSTTDGRSCSFTISSSSISYDSGSVSY